MITSNAVHLQHLRTLKITPQLRQAIGLLQFNNRALSAFLAIQASSNPHLKLMTAGDPPTGGGADKGKAGPESPRGAGLGGGGQASGASDWRETEEGVASLADGLYEHVRRQIDLSIRDPRRRAIAYLLAESLEPSGWLGRPVAKIAAEAACPVDEVESVLAILQGFEPTGLFARSLAECLRLQAIEAGILTDTLALVLDNLELIGAGKIDRVARLANKSPDAIMDEVKKIRRLNPKPGAAFDSTPTPVTPPDLLVSQTDGDWQVELNRSNLPAIRVQDDVAAGSGEKDLLLAEARWLEKAVARRNVTTLTIASELVRRQRDFLANGPASLVPMSFADIAAAVGVHESTVSRVTANLMMATPRGTVLLRELFSVALPSQNGGGSISAVAVREEMRRMIRAEDPASPVSDEAMAAHFQGRGVSIARRTIAKYRDLLGIPGSAARKQRAELSRR